MNPSYQAGLNFGNNVGRAFTNIQDKTALDEILENAASSNDPNQITDTMTQLLGRIKDPQKRQEAVKILEFKYKGAVERQKQQKETEVKQKERQAKIDSGYDPDLPTPLAKEKYKSEQKAGRLATVFGDQAGQQVPGEMSQQETIEPSQQPQVSQKSQNPFANMTKDRLIPLTGSQDIEIREGAKQQLKEIENQEKIELDKKKIKRTDFQKDREYHTQFSKPIVEQSAKTLQIIPARKGLVNQWRRDISSGKTSGLGQYLVDRSGLEFWRNPESSRAKTAAKEYFIEGLSSLSPGTRPNQFIEQQLSSALPTIGRDKESGLTVLEMQDFLDDLKEQYARNVVDIAEEDNEKYGYERKDIGIRAQKKLDQYADQRQKELATRIRTIHEDQLDDKQLSKELFLEGGVPQGTPLTQRVRSILMIKNNEDADAAMREAIRLGYELK